MIPIGAPWAEVFAECEAQARLAAAAQNDRLPPEQSRGLDCGFAWVVVKPARGPFINWCRKNGKGSRRDYGGGGWEFWCTGYNPTQSISVHQAAAKAFADVLIRQGIPGVTTGSRFD